MQRISPFLSLIVVSGCLLSLGFSSKLNAQDHNDSNTGKVEESKSDSDAKPKPALNEKLKTAMGWGEIEIKLSPMVPTEEIRGIGWSPKAGSTSLSESDEGLKGRMAIGDFEPLNILIKVNDGDTKKGTARLQVDANGDAKFDDSETYDIKANERRGRYWYSSPDISVLLKSKEGQTTDEPRPYSVSFWHVVNPDEPDEKPVIRWTRNGWYQGQFKLGDQTCTAVLSDADLDGSFTDNDAWGIGKTPAEARLYGNSAYRVAKHAWFDSVAYQVTSVDKNGASLKIHAVDIGVTQAEEKAKADPYAKDRKFPRSEKPVVFLHNYEEALALAKKEDKRIVVDFVTTWCGPCHTMDRLVYSAKPVVDKSKDVIFLKLDGDDEAELNKQYKIKGYPTLILLDADGKEIQRRVGYQGVSKLLDFIK